MLGNWCNSKGGCGLARSRNAAGASRRASPRVVFGGGPGFAVRTAEHLHRLGCDVCTAWTPAALQALAVRNRTAAILLPVENGGESGFLTCAKLRLTRPKLQVVLVGEPTPRVERFAGFVGARFATEAKAADAVMNLI